MATLKLKKTGTPNAANAKSATNASTETRAPLRGNGVKARPTLAAAQAQRAEREARYQEQLRQRFGKRPAPSPRAAQAGADRPAARHAAEADLDQAAPRPGARPAPNAAAKRSPRADIAQHERENSAAFGRNANRTGRTEHVDRVTQPHTDRFVPLATDRRTRPGAERTGDAPAHADGSLRLSKRMSELGIASRREADEWIARGWVRVDGRVVSELGSRVMPEQHVTVDAKARNQQAQRVTVLLNKPVGFVSGQAEDGYEPALVLVTPQTQWREDHSGTRFLREHLKSLVPAGRLDIDSVGLLVLTQDGRVAKQLIGEDSEIEKEYLVRVALPAGGNLAADKLALLNHGLELDGEPLRPAQVEWLNQDQLRFVLRQGKKRQIRRMCEAVGLQVLGLKRVRIGSVVLGDLPTGQWRYLRRDEGFG